MPNFESSMCKTFGVDDPTFMFYIGGHASKVPSFHRMTHGDEDKSSPCPPQDGSNLAPVEPSYLTRRASYNHVIDASL